MLLVINKQANSNVIETVDRIYALIPELKRWIPAGIDISVLSDRTKTIRASVQDMQLTLLATVVLVMVVVFVFLRNARAALITRGLAEMTRLGIRYGGRIETFMGLAGAGDLRERVADRARHKQ